MVRITKNTPVYTSDHYVLGQTHAYHHRLQKPHPELGLYPTFLMIVNFTIGDDFYIPTVFIDRDKSTNEEIWLTISKKEIEVKQYTRLPVDDHYHHEILPDGDGESEVPVSVDEDTVPLAPVAPMPSEVDAKS